MLSRSARRQNAPWTDKKPFSRNRRQVERNLLPNALLLEVFGRQAAPQEQFLLPPLAAPQEAFRLALGATREKSSCVFAARKIRNALRSASLPMKSKSKIIRE